MNISLNIYDKTGKKVERVVTAETYDIMFGSVVSLMELINIKDTTDTAAVLKLVVSAWDEIRGILSGFFPNMNENDWKCVKLKEIVVVIVEILKFSLSEMMGIPTNPKNA